MRKQMSLIFLFIVFGLFVSAFVYADWTAPLATAPTCASGNPGCDDPINTGSVEQIRSGALTVATAGGIATGFVVVNGNVGIGASNPVAKLEIRPLSPSEDFNSNLLALSPQGAQASPTDSWLFSNRGGKGNLLIYSQWDKYELYLDTDNAVSIPNQPDKEFFRIWRGAVPPLGGSGLIFGPEGSIAAPPQKIFEVRGTGELYNLGPMVLGGVSAPAAPPGGTGMIYYDSVSRKFKCYEGPGPATDCVLGGGGGQWTTSGSDIFNANSGQVRVNANNSNTGTLASGGLLFGDSSTQEGIASKRNVGGNQWGLDFYTGGVNRMAITSAGNVGIGTAATVPGAKLEIVSPNQNTVRLKKTSGSAGSVEMFPAVGDATSRTGQALCRTVVPTNAVCLGYWTFAGAISDQAPCTVSAPIANGRALCADFGD